MKLPLNLPITSRDGTLTKDSKIINMLGNEKRPGLQPVFNPGNTEAGQGLFCINGVLASITNNKVIDSSKPIISGWTMETVPLSEQWTNITWNGQIFCAVGAFNHYSATSPDGINWTMGSMPSTVQWSKVRWNGSIFLACGGDATNKCATSVDGLIWVERTLPTYATWQALTVANGQFLLVGNGLVTLLTYDGLTFVQGVFPSITALSVIWTGAFFCAQSTTLTTVSTDGITWGPLNALPAGSFATMGFNGVYLVTLSQNSAVGAYSSDGILWTAVTIPTTSEWMAIAYGTGIFCAVSLTANSIVTLTSLDGVVWSVGATIPTASQWATIAWNGNVFCTMSTKGLAAISHALTYASYSIPGAVGTVPYNILGACSSYSLIHSTQGLWTYSAGTITQVTDPDYPATTVPGIVNLDESVYVMDTKANILGSNIGDPYTWTALNTIQANDDTDCSVAIARHLNYLVAFKDRSIEFFYDAGSPPPGSPLLRVASAYAEIGCASATSIVATENLVIFMSKTLERGRAISVIQGLQVTTLSDHFIDKILNNDTLATVYAFTVKVAGHAMYVLTLKASNITIVYDFTTKQWSQFTSSVAKDAVTITSLTQLNGVATAVCASHTFSDGDPVDIAGATPAGYNGRFNITYVSGTTFTFPVGSSLATPATGAITAIGYTQSYFTGINYASCAGQDLLQHESNGKVYSMLPTVYQDDGLPIDVQAITQNLEPPASSGFQHISAAEVIGDKVVSTGLLRYSDKDYQTWSQYRPVDMSLPRSRVLRLGATRRRAFQFRHTDNVAVRLEHLLLTVV